MGCLVRGGGEGEEGAGVDRTARIQAGRQFGWMGEWGRVSRARAVKNATKILLDSVVDYLTILLTGISGIFVNNLPLSS